MSQDIDRLAAGFERVFDDPAPPTSVNADLLVARGHRLLRRRRTTGAVFAVATTVVLALLATVLPGITAPPVPTGGSGGVPLLTPARFGWLPTAPDAYDYSIERGAATVIAEWADKPPHDGPRLTLTPAEPLLPPSATSPPSPGAAPTGDRATRVGTIDGNPVWYCGYSQVTPGAIDYSDFLLWKTASGAWAQLQDPGVDSPTLLRIAKAANTDPAPLTVPLGLTGDLSGLTITDLMLVQTVDDDGMEYVVDGYLRQESVSITAFGGDTGITTRNGTKCDFATVGDLGSAPLVCGGPWLSADQGVAATSGNPSYRSDQPGRYNTGAAPEAASEVSGGVFVYVGVVANEKFDSGLSQAAMKEVTVFGLSSDDWHPFEFGG